ncbi:hypothetical protein L1987_74800 [Smallanthus sonchifolius]|uniref:Uncharacterized protein n=1 Tax=Smallanthus sonchifolius TaxID=185202 RepID=A0ACB9A828_9ASTR|nr:hypothetical protein L1987_74800 [Smallanthus sonchifolius]
MQVTGGRVRTSCSNRGWSCWMACTKLTNDDMDGRLSVISTPGGKPTMLSGKGMSMTEMESVFRVASMAE